MGKHGIGAARAIRARGPLSEVPKDEDLPWNVRVLSRVGRVVAFLEWLPVTSGPLAGTNMKLLPMQLDFIKNVYGPVDKKGLRIVREALLSTAKKNGKTGLAAGLCACQLSGPESEPRGRCYSAATTRQQAALIFEELEAMIYARPWLAARTNIISFGKTIWDSVNDSKYQALSSDAKTEQGINPSFWIYDELGEAKNADLYNVLSQGGGARDEPLGIVISTQAERDDHIMSELVDAALQMIANDDMDPAYYAAIYIAPDDADIYDEKVWAACNPALGVFKSLEDMRFMARKVKRMPALESSFRRLSLNQRVTTTEQLIPAAAWKACGGEVDIEELYGRECYGGLDLSERRDLTALVLVFPREGGYDVLPFFWLPEDGLEEKEKNDRAHYTLWAREGHLLTTTGRSIRYRYIAPKLQEILEQFDVKEIAYDRWKFRQFLDAIEDANDAGYCNISVERDEDDNEVILNDRTRLTRFGQGYKDQSPAVDNVENAIVDGELSHGMHPVLTMCAANVVVASDPAGGRKFAKDKSRGRIDGIVALAQALTIAPVRDKEDEPSVYEKRGLRAF